MQIWQEKLRIQNEEHTIIVQQADVKFPTRLRHYSLLLVLSAKLQNLTKREWLQQVTVLPLTVDMALILVRVVQIQAVLYCV